MKLSLTTWQIINCQGIIGMQKGDAALIRKAAKCLDALELTDEQKKSVSLQLVNGKDDKGNPFSFWSWANREARFDVEIADREAANYFRQVLKVYNEWLPRDVKQVDDLLEQLEKE